MLQKLFRLSLIILACLSTTVNGISPAYNSFQERIKNQFEQMGTKYNQIYDAFLNGSNIPDQCQTRSYNVCSGLGSLSSFENSVRPNSCYFGNGFRAYQRSALLFPEDFQGTNEALVHTCISGKLQPYFRQMWSSFQGYGLSLEVTGPSGVIRTYPGKQIGNLCSQGYYTSTPNFVTSACGPKNVFILMDNSQSMAGLELNQCIDGIKGAFDLFSETDRVQVATMNEHFISLGGSNMIPANKQNINELVSSLQNVTASGSNDFFKAIDQSLKQLNQSSDCRHNLLLLITNGNHNHNHQNFSQEVDNLIDKYQGLSWEVLAIGISNQDLDFNDLQILASKTNGSAYEVTRIGQVPQQIRKYYESIIKIKKAKTMIIDGPKYDPKFNQVVTFSLPVYYAKDQSEPLLTVLSATFSVDRLIEGFDIQRDEILGDFSFCNAFQRKPNLQRNTSQSFSSTLQEHEIISNNGQNPFTDICPYQNDLEMLIGVIVGSLLALIIVICCCCFGFYYYCQKNSDIEVDESQRNNSNEVEPNLNPDLNGDNQQQPNIQNAQRNHANGLQQNTNDNILPVIRNESRSTGNQTNRQSNSFSFKHDGKKIYTPRNEPLMGENSDQDSYSLDEKNNRNRVRDNKKRQSNNSNSFPNLNRTQKKRSLNEDKNGKVSNLFQKFESSLMNEIEQFSPVVLDFGILSSQQKDEKSKVFDQRSFKLSKKAIQKQQNKRIKQPQRQYEEQIPYQKQNSKSEEKQSQSESDGRQQQPESR